MEHLLNQRFAVDISPKPRPLRVAKTKGFFSIGDEVMWKVEPRKKQAFITHGVIEDIHTTTVAGKHKKVARLYTSSKYQEVFPMRKVTTVALEKLRRIS